VARCRTAQLHRIWANGYLGERKKPEGERLKEDALRELEQSSSWMKLLVDDGVLRSGRVCSLLKEFDELIAIFVRIINRAKDK
jgi:hypothetical protein